VWLHFIAVITLLWWSEIELALSLRYCLYSFPPDIERIVLWNDGLCPAFEENHRILLWSASGEKYSGSSMILSSASFSNAKYCIFL
jgi:hypothetical protein